MSEHTAVSDKIQCAGAALQPVPNTDPPKFDLVENVLAGLIKKTGLDKSDIGEIRPVGLAFWQKSKDGPLHTTAIYEAQTPEKSAEQLKQHIEEFSRTQEKPQLQTTVSVNPRNKIESRELSDRLPSTGQRAYVKEVVKARSREHTRGLFSALRSRLGQIEPRMIVHKQRGKTPSLPGPRQAVDRIKGIINKEKEKRPFLHNEMDVIGRFSHRKKDL